MQRSKGFMRFLAFVSVVAVSAAVFSGISSAQQPQASDSVRVEVAKRFGGRWRAACAGDSCDLNILLQQSVEMPAAADKVDAVVTLTLDYKTSRGDRGDILVTYSDPSATGGPVDVVMEPGPFPLVSAVRQRTSSTLTWVVRELDAAGRSYTFQLVARSRDKNGNGRSVISGTRLSAVIDVRPSGS